MKTTIIKEQPEASKSKFVFPKYLYARTKDNKTLDISYAPQSIDATEYIRNDFVEQEQQECGHFVSEYVSGKKPKWNIGDILAYYICTSNEEGERIIGKIANVEFDEEAGWIYTFEDKGASDEESLVEEGVYKKN